MNQTDKPNSSPAPRRLSMDMSVRQPAAALHSRVKSSANVLDLRQAAEAKSALAEETTTAVITPTPRPSRPAPAAPPKSATHERHIAQNTDRFNQAKQVERSPHINKFASVMPAEPDFMPETAIAATVAAPPAAPVSAPAPMPRPGHIVIPDQPAPELPSHAATHHEAMTKLVQTPPIDDPMPQSAKPAWRPHLKLSPNAGRVAATAAAITIMTGYIWLQNYPKLALQAAGNKAGLSVSLPGYIPSSYNLAATDTSPGLVTLNFRSPSTSDTLKIAQHRTDWDSSSLLDNFVSKNTDDYATVQGQGLTIYVFNNNQATWVNHGIWYSIEGASRLSREQILKIAYSL